jgi:hypothetical protein
MRDRRAAGRRARVGPAPNARDARETGWPSETQTEASSADQLQDIINAIRPRTCLLPATEMLLERGEAGYEQFKADWLRTYYSTLKIVEKIKRRSSDRV